MANVNSPMGLVPVKKLDGSAWNGQVRPYFVASTYATALFQGDPVVKTGTSNTATVSYGDGSFAPGTLPEVSKATAGATNPITGVVVGFGVNPNALERTYNPASTEAVVWCSDSVDVVYEAQCSAGFAATDVGSNAALTFAVGGSTFTGKSGVQVDSTTFATGATLQVKVLRLVNKPNNALGTNAKVELMLNLSTEVPGVAGI